MERKSVEYTVNLGCIRQLPDIRDLTFSAKLDASALPRNVDLRTSPCNPVIWDQGELGSCTAFASARLQEFTYSKDGFHNPFEPSHLFQYYNSRWLENTQDSDSGASIRDAIKAGAKYGICAEHWFPYDVTKFAETPPAQAYLNAAKHKTLTYHAVAATDLKTALAEGYPVEVGISVYDSFYDSQDTGVVPMPSTSESLLGGHALAVVGYDDSEQHWIVANSWGANYGDHGYVYLPYPYLLNENLSFDFWTLRIQH